MILESAYYRICIFSHMSRSTNSLMESAMERPIAAVVDPYAIYETETKGEEYSAC